MNAFELASITLLSFIIGWSTCRWSDKRKLRAIAARLDDRPNLRCAVLNAERTL